MIKPLPRVSPIYKGTVANLHDWLDAALPKFRESYLGQAWPNFLAGHHDVSGRAYETMCPFDRDLLVARLVSADKKAVKAAIFAAREAFPAWSAMAWKKRVQVIRRWAKVIDRRKYDLAMAALYEVGKPRLEAIGEAEEAVDLVNRYCDEMERNDGFVHKMKRSHPKEETLVAMRPVGVFAVITPFNYPVALPCNMLAACLVAGNTAVFTPAPETGLTGALLTETAEAAGLPDGVLNMLNGEDAGALLADTPGVDGIAFTGSHAVGMRIIRKIASEPFVRPVIAEMGGKNTAYVTAKADLNVAAHGLINAAFGLQGQTCSAGTAAFAERPIVPALLTKLAERAKALHIGSPEVLGTDLGPVIDQAAMDRYDRTVKAARAKGTIIYGGEKLRTGAWAKGYFIQPLIIADLPADHWINREELLLPVLSIVTVDSLDEAIAHGNRSPYGQSAIFYSRDQKEIGVFLGRAEAGALSVNRVSGGTIRGPGRSALARYMREQSQTIVHS
ncbi:L-glutamate gamma-semialdehyde dehydrogenase [soil metagenome]